MLDKRLNEITTSPNVQIQPWLLLDFGDFFRDISAKNTDGCHSLDVMVFEATYLVAALTPGQASACCGQFGAQISMVLRPNGRSNKFHPPLGGSPHLHYNDSLCPGAFVVSPAAGSIGSSHARTTASRIRI